MDAKTRILVVDDEDNLRATLSEILAEEGYDVDSVGDGHSALARSRSRCYDVVLLDVRLPDSNGVEVFRQIRVLCPESRVILMSAYSLDSLRQTALSEGAAAFLAKPLDLAGTLALVAGSRPAGSDG